jgi:hypothetical protein
LDFAKQVGLRIAEDEAPIKQGLREYRETYVAAGDLRQRRRVT